MLKVEVQNKGDKKAVCIIEHGGVNVVATCETEVEAAILKAVCEASIKLALGHVARFAVATINGH